MLFDLTWDLTPQDITTAQGQEAKALVGHLGTHFDVMNQTFPLAYTRRSGIVFDVSAVRGRDIDLPDIRLDCVQRDQFVAFYTGFIEEVPYGVKPYFTQHPQLSEALIDALLDRKISIIGVDCAGIRRGKAHTPMDQHCADHGVFVVENLCGLRPLVQAGGRFIAHTYPMRYRQVTGLPCRVVGEIPDPETTGTTRDR